MRISASETEPEYAHFAVAIVSCLQIFDNILNIQHTLLGIEGCVAALSNFAIRRWTRMNAPKDIWYGYDKAVICECTGEFQNSLIGTPYRGDQKDARVGTVTVRFS